MDFGCEHFNINLDNKGVNPVNDLYLLFQYLRIFNRLRPDVILAYTAKPNIYGSIAARFYSIPVVNNITGLGTAFISTGLANKVAKIFYKFTFFHCYNSINMF